jgi:2-(1,2-epoxy-1,2-dihydrophenyl)acetyl-CoA isomerase
MAIMEYIQLEEDIENKVAIIHMKSESNKGNSFKIKFLNELLQKLGELERDERFNSIIITGNGHVFAVGGDVKDMATKVREGFRDAYVAEIVPVINKIVKKIVSYALPVIMRIDGAAAGGGLSLALCGDHIICIEKTKLAMAFGVIALTPDSGSSVIFPHRFGYSEALFGISTGKVYTPEEAMEFGAIGKIARNMEELEEIAMSYAIKYAEMDRDTIIDTKKLLNTDLILKLKSQLRNEFESIVNASKRDSFVNRLNGFLNKMK